MEAKMVEGGLLIPKEMIESFGEVEILVKPMRIVVKPKDMTQRTKGIIKPPVSLTKLLEEYEMTGGSELLES